MYWVITIMLMFHGTDTVMEREYLLKHFNDDLECHAHVYENKIELLTPHVIEYGESLRSFEFFCETRYAEEV